MWQEFVSDVEWKPGEYTFVRMPVGSENTPSGEEEEAKDV
jgi:hypothetical protein